MSDMRTMDGGRALHLARVISGALVAGVLIYAVVAWFLVRSGAVPPLDPGPAELVKQAWIVVMFACVIGWMVLWGRARHAAASAAARVEIVEETEGPGGLLRILIGGYALLEAVGLLGVTTYLLTGSLSALVPAVAIVVIGTALSFPRAEWFEPFRRLEGHRV